MVFNFVHVQKNDIATFPILVFESISWNLYKMEQGNWGRLRKKRKICRKTRKGNPGFDRLVWVRFRSYYFIIFSSDKGYSITFSYSMQFLSESETYSKYLTWSAWYRYLFSLALQEGNNEFIVSNDSMSGQTRARGSDRHRDAQQRRHRHLPSGSKDSFGFETRSFVSLYRFFYHSFLTKLLLSKGTE